MGGRGGRALELQHMNSKGRNTIESITPSSSHSQAIYLTDIYQGLNTFDSTHNIKYVPHARHYAGHWNTAVDRQTWSLCSQSFAGNKNKYSIITDNRCCDRGSVGCHLRDPRKNMELQSCR